MQVDAIENITHSMCTLEFESRRASYYWLLEVGREGEVWRSSWPPACEPHPKCLLPCRSCAKARCKQLVAKHSCLPLRQAIVQHSPRLPVLSTPADAQVLGTYKPLVWEYSRLNITHNVMSKRKLNKLVTDK